MSLSRHDHAARHTSELEALSAPFRMKKKVPVDEAEGAILALCAGRFLTVARLSELTGRSSDSLRNHFLNRMVGEGRLQLRYPYRRTHPAQAYTTA